MTAVVLTILTISKDDPAGLGRTLASAAALRIAGAEHIVIDGSSNPEVADAITSGAHDGVRILQRPAQGIADAFNAGLAEARGEWVWFLNGGDQIDSRLGVDFLFTLLKTSRAEMIIGGITYEGDTKPHPHPSGEKQWPPLLSWIPHPATLVRRQLFGRFGGYDGRYSIAMDYEWWLRVLSNDVKVDVVTVPFAVFAPDGISQRLDSRAVVAAERDDAIRRHQNYLWRAWISSGIQLVRAWVTAQLARRLGSSSRQI